MLKHLTPEQEAILAAYPTAIAWHGGDCPVDLDSEPIVFFTGGEMVSGHPAKFWTLEDNWWNWCGYPGRDSIIAYIPDPDFPLSIVKQASETALTEDEMELLVATTSWVDCPSCNGASTSFISGKFCIVCGTRGRVLSGTRDVIAPLCDLYNQLFADHADLISRAEAIEAVRSVRSSQDYWRDKAISYINEIEGVSHD
jgi:hypothetical protein